MINASQTVDDIIKNVQYRIDSIKRIISKRQITIRDLDIAEELKYTKVEELKKIENPSYNLRKLIKCKESIRFRFQELKGLNMLNMPITAMMEMLKAYNRQMQRDILLGDVVYLGKNIGQMRTVIIRNNYRKVKRRIDWDKSFYVLESIAAEVAPDILAEYKSGQIHRNIFIHKMRKFTYSKENPSYPKWLVDHLEDTVPYIKVRFSKYVKNNRSYVFVPTNFINHEVRSQVEFTDRCKDREEILNSAVLGTRDKLFGLCRYEPNMINSYVDIKYFYL